MPNNFFSLIGGDYGIVQTVGRMKSAIYGAMRNPKQPLRRRAEMILAHASERDELNEIRNIFHFVQDHLHYINDPYDIELLKTPDLLDAEITNNGEFMGDCDDASAYLAALLKTVGYLPYLTIAAPEGEPGFDYSHVYVTVFMPTRNQWIALDPTAKGKPLGWQVPAKKVSHYAV